MADQDDFFDVNTAFTDIPLNEEVAKLDSKVKKRAEKRSKEDREKQRELNREQRKAKKEQRELNKKRKRGEVPISDNEETAAAEGDAKGKDKKAKDKKAAEKSAEFGVWVGNLSFQTSPQDVLKHFTQCGSVVRMRCPSGQRHNKNKGFAYIFFGTTEEMEKALELNEKELDGRALLIKKADDFQRKDGITREEADKATKEMVREQFQNFGDMHKVRMATFEDTGKCKGFGYIDFCELDSAVKAIRAPDKHVLDGRKIRVEYASEDAYNRGRPWILRNREKAEEEAAAAAAAAAAGDVHGGSGGEGKDVEATTVADEDQTEPEKRHKKRRSEENEDQTEPEKRHRKRRSEENEDGSVPEKRRKTKGSSGRLAPGQALFEAQRQRPTVQEFKGTKITFGDD